MPFAWIKRVGCGLGLISLCVFSGACTTQPVLLVPTVAVLPTSVPTRTATITWTPSATFTPTQTSTAVPTTAIPVTPTATLTVTTDAISKTPSLTPSYTAIPPTVAATLVAGGSSSQAGIMIQASPVASPQILAPTILTFGMSKTNSTVTLSWTSTSDILTLDELTGSGTLVNSVGVPLTGSQTFKLDRQYGQSLTFRLTADQAGQSVTRTVIVPIDCPNSWFFTPSPPGCPVQAFQAADNAEFQQFQRGIGMYVPATNMVYLLAYAGSQVTAYPIDAANGAPAPITPPKGLSAPDGHLGVIWENQTWPDKTPLKKTLGWAVAPAQMFRVLIQLKSPSDLYFNSPANTIYELNLTSNTWTIAVGLH